MVVCSVVILLLHNLVNGKIYNHLQSGIFTFRKRDYYRRHCSS
jgi:hypothetical protein